MIKKNRDFRDSFASPESTILDALRAIDNAALQIALVVDRNNKLLGTVTDGDIRRAILSGVTLDDPVTRVMNGNFTSVTDGTPPGKIRALMAERKIHQIPVIDAQGRVTGIARVDTLLEDSAAISSLDPVNPRDVPVVLMLGGEGKRLHPLTETMPKPMISVGGRPLLETIVRQFVQQGFTQFFFCLNYKADMIRDHFGTGKNFGAHINYMIEPQKMGTAGALSLLPESARTSGPVIVMNGDLLTNVNFTQMLYFHQQNHAAATMGVREYSHELPYGVVQNNGARLESITEKPSHSYFVNAGIYVLGPETLALIPDNAPLDMPQLFERLAGDDHESVVFPIREYWLDIGRFEDLERARAEYAGVFG